MLLRHGADLNFSIRRNVPHPLLGFYSENDEEFPLMTTACGKAVSPVELLLKAGADINQMNSIGQTALHGRCISLNVDYSNNILKTLLSHSADVHLRDAYGRTPLHYACRNAWSDTVNILLEAGAKVNIVDSVGWTELEIAAQSYRDPDLKVQRLMESYSYPTGVIIEVYETLAWSLLRNNPDADCLDNAIGWMRKATLLRKEQNLPKTVLGSLECYGFTKEWQTMEDLELYQNSHDGLQMQAMIALERIYKGRYTRNLLWENIIFQSMYDKQSLYTVACNSVIASII